MSKSIEYSPIFTPRQIIYSKKPTTPSQIIYRLVRKGKKPLNIIIDSNYEYVQDRCLEISENTYTYCNIKDTKDLVILILERVLFSNYVKIVKFRTYRVYYERDLYYTVKWFMIVDFRTNVPDAIIICFYPTDHTCYSTLIIFLF